MIVTARGDLDIVMSRQFDEYLTQARREHSWIILDLSAVDFMDTSALAVIVGHWKQLATSGGTLALAGPRYRYTKALWITGLADRLPLYESVDQAIAAGSSELPREPAPPASDAPGSRTPASDAPGSRTPASDAPGSDAPGSSAAGHQVS
jgi:anti-sigma B factor antagonist